MEKRSAVFAALWLSAAAIGLGKLAADSSRAGRALHANRAWPAASSIALDRSKPTLVAFIHPKCGCSRATLTELGWILSHGRAAATVYFVRPTGKPQGWERTELWTEAVGYGARAVADPAGAQARVFGAMTSGTILVYAPGGSLLYSGGATGARGHEGDNAGRRAILAALDGQAAATTAPVFGCALAALELSKESYE
jgi:hypothetical protein